MNKVTILKDVILNSTKSCILLFLLAILIYMDIVIKNELSIFGSYFEKSMALKTIKSDIIKYVSIEIIIIGIDYMFDCISLFFEYDFEYYYQKLIFNSLLNKPLKELILKSPEAQISRLVIVKNALVKSSLLLLIVIPRTSISLIIVLNNFMRSTNFIEDIVSKIVVTAIIIYGIIFSYSVYLRKYIKIKWIDSKIERNRYLGITFNNKDILRVYSLENKEIEVSKSKYKKYSRYKLKFHIISEIFRLLMRIIFIFLRVMIAHNKTFKTGILKDIDIRIAFSQIDNIGFNLLSLRNAMYFFIENWNDIDLKYLKSFTNNDKNSDVISLDQFYLRNSLRCTDLSLELPMLKSKLSCSQNKLDECVVKFQNFDFNPGDFILLYGNLEVGLNLVNTIVGLSKYSGSFKFGSTEIKDIDKNILKRCISYMPSEQIFDRSIISNICYGTGMSEDKVKLKIHELGFSKYFDQIQNSYMAKVGSKICGLSKGQKQVICILRCIIKDSYVYIFNDPTMFLDPYMRDIIMNMIFKLENKIVIILSNTNQYHQYFNKIIKI